ncbi:MAG: cation diffusion facilitator family transporter [Fimbriimonas sp.]|nr:cation diffusion facilitator family transporter [Fimbriimonas sp.]
MHDHSNCEHHQPANYSTAFAIGVALNATFVIVEIMYGIMARSLSLLADAGHNVGDVLGLLMGWGAAYLTTRPPTERRTYGYRRSSILAALANSSLLLVAVGAIAWEAVQRLSKPVGVPGSVVMSVAAFGILINGGTALMFVRGRKNDLNIEGAYMHMLTDAIVAFGVVLAGLAIKLTGAAWIDTASSLVIVALIAIGSWSLLRRSFDLAIDAVPSGIDPSQVRSYLVSQVGVTAVSDLHIWGMSTTEIALTAHLVMPRGCDEDFVAEIAHELSDRFGIAHSTIQVDRSTKSCVLTV